MNSYRGNERRQHVLYVTQNTEYHLRGAECVGVRDLWSGHWREDHPAERVVTGERTVQRSAARSSERLCLDRKVWNPLRILQ